MKYFLFVTIFFIVSCQGKKIDIQRGIPVDLTKKTIIPEPDTTKESQSLLVIPFSVEYPSKYGHPVKGWGIKFSSKTGIFDKDKTILFDPKMGQDYIVVEMEPGSYYVSKIMHPGSDAHPNNFVDGSYPRSRP